MENVDSVLIGSQQPSAGVVAAGATAPNTQAPKQIVHVRGDSETELDLLFSVLNSREQKKPPIRSFREMNLPPSFFRPPAPRPVGYHSRDASLDGVSTSNQLLMNSQSLASGGHSTGGASAVAGIFHSRSHSSPAQLPLNASLSVVPPPSGNSHLKHASAELSATGGETQQQHQQQMQSRHLTNNNNWPTTTTTHQLNNNNFFVRLTALFEFFNCPIGTNEIVYHT